MTFKVLSSTLSPLVQHRFRGRGQPSHTLKGGDEPACRVACVKTEKGTLRQKEHVEGKVPRPVGGLLGTIRLEQDP